MFAKTAQTKVVWIAVLGVGLRKELNLSETISLVCRSRFCTAQFPVGVGRELDLNQLSVLLKDKGLKVRFEAETLPRAVFVYVDKATFIVFFTGRVNVFGSLSMVEQQVFLELLWSEFAYNCTI